MMYGKPTEPIIDIVTPDGERRRATFKVDGVQYAVSFGAANAEAKALGLTDWKLDTVGWTKPEPCTWGPTHLD